MRKARLGLVLLAGMVGCAGGARSSNEDTRDIAPPGFNNGPTAFVDGGVAAPARLQAVIVADTPPPALSGGTLAVAKDGSVVVAADPDRDQLYVVHPGTQGVQKIALDKGSEPGRVALDGAGRAHVALRGRGSLLAIDLKTAKKGTETPVCKLPRGVTYDAAHDAILVACSGGELVTLAAADHTKLGSSDLGLDLRDVIVNGDGTLQVSRYRSAELLQVADGALKGTSAPKAMQQQRFPRPMFDADGGLPEPFDPTPSNVTMSPALAWKTVAVSDGGTMMLHQASQDDEVVISSSGGYGGGCETITQTGLTLYDQAGAPLSTMTLAPRGLVVDLAVSADGHYIALAEPGGYLRGTPTLELLQRDSQSSAIPTPIPPALLGDSGLAGLLGDGGLGSDFGGIFDAGGPQVSCISGAMFGEDTQITAVAFDEAGALYALSREPAKLIVYSPQQQDPMFGPSWPFFDERNSYTLDTNSVRDTGHELFHADVGSGISCASCHGEALDDGHVWNFRDFGPRRTQTMRGGLLSTLPLHWEGDLATFQNLVDEVMTRRMGGFPVEAKYGTALANWVDKLPPMKLGGAQDDAALRGKALFESAEVACNSCHTGEHFTDNKSFDVGTGGLFQVPTLLGVALHPPFLHDGCAQTLEERFEPSCGGGDKHGHTSQLTGAQISDLVSYLKTL